MTEERKAELRRLCEAATAGPWGATEHTGNLVSIAAADRAVADVAIWCSGVAGSPDENSANGALIAASRAALPELLDALDELQAAAKIFANLTSEVQALAQPMDPRVGVIETLRRRLAEGDAAADQATRLREALEGEMMFAAETICEMFREGEPSDEDDWSKMQQRIEDLLTTRINKKALAESPTARMATIQAALALAEAYDSAAWGEECASMIRNAMDKPWSAYRAAKEAERV